MQRASRLAASKFRNLAPSNNVICRSFCNTGFLKNKKEGDFKEKFKQQFSQLERILEEDRKTLDLISFGTTVEAADLAKHPFYTYDVKLYQMGWDSEFNEKEFLEGAKEAFITLRELLVEDPTQLEALFTPDAYDGFKEWLKFVTEDKNCKIYGNVDKIDEVQILNIRVDPEGETIINVRVSISNNYHVSICLSDLAPNKQYKFIETLYVEDEEGNVVAGKKSPQGKIGFVSFYRKSTEDDWLVRAVVNPYILALNAEP